MLNNKKKKRRFGSSELVKLGVDSSVLRSLDGPRLRDSRNRNATNSNNSSTNSRKRKRVFSENCENVLSESPSTRRWVRCVLSLQFWRHELIMLQLGFASIF